MPVKEKKTNSLMIWINAQLVWVAGFLAVILLVAGYFFIIKPKIDAHEARPELSLEQVRYDLETQQAKLNQLKDLINEYKSLSPEHFKKVEEFLPSDSDAPIIFTHLDALARANNSALLSVSASESGERELIEQKVRQGLDLPDNIKVINVSADFLVAPGAGGYPFFKQLIASIENNLRLMDIEYINFSPDLDSISINAKTYYLQR